MTKTFFESIEPGMEQQLGQHTFGKDEIIEFAREFDPQRFHLDEAAAQDSQFGKLCASGWHTASMWMHYNVKNGLSELLRLTDHKGNPPILGPSPGVRNIKWLIPVFVGDTITYTSTVSSKRNNPKRPGWGMVTSHSQGVNQNGKLVLSMDGSITLRVD